MGPSSTTGLLVLALLGSAAAIYPEGHWNHATKLSNAIVDDFVKENVDAGKVRPVCRAAALHTTGTPVAHAAFATPSRCLGPSARAVPPASVPALPRSALVMTSKQLSLSYESSLRSHAW